MKEQKICLIGDIHGQWETMVKNIENKEIIDYSLIQVGDFGVGFNDKYTDIRNLENLNERLKKSNNIMYVIRGNHDNPDFFNGQFEYSNLKLLKDYSVINIDGIYIGLIGGAISVDRKPRLKEMTEYARYGKDRECYWYDEHFVLDKTLAESIKGCRYIITHTAPDFCWPNNKLGFGQIVNEFSALGDSNLKTELNKERKDMTMLYEILKKNNHIDAWIYGHYHNNKVTEYENATFRLLGIHELYELR